MTTRRWTIGIVVLCCWTAGETRGQPINGDFEDGLTGWTATANGVSAATSEWGASYALFVEPGDGGRSRIYQEFVLPASPYLSFRYALMSAPGTRSSVVPPDSFTAFLTDLAGNRLVVPPGEPPSFSTGFYYADADGHVLYDGSLVTVAGPDRDGLHAVALNISSLTASPDVRVEFGLATGSNEVDSYAVLDDVQIGCPESIWCCAPDGTLTLVDDDNPCTIDTCDANGVPVHTPLDPSECCGDCNSIRANIVLMLDLTGSMSNEDVAAEVAGAKSLLSVFKEGDPWPRVAIGTFHGPCADTSQSGCTAIADDHARIKAGFTNVYGDDDGAEDGDLYAILDQIDSDAVNRPDSAQTDLQSAINVAQGIMPVPEDELAPHYIILISDGVPNIPKGDCDHEEYCDCLDSDAAAEQATIDAEAAGTDIFAVHYMGNGYQECTDEPEAGRVFMRDKMATSSAFFFEGDNVDPGDTYKLICAFHGVVQSVSCDDGSPVTRDCCSDGQCAHGTVCETQ